MSVFSWTLPEWGSRLCSTVEQTLEHSPHCHALNTPTSLSIREWPAKGADGPVLAAAFSSSRAAEALQASPTCDLQLQDQG